jgi:hypothetical protein
LEGGGEGKRGGSKISKRERENADPARRDLWSREGWRWLRLVPETLAEPQHRWISWREPWSGAKPKGRAGVKGGHNAPSLPSRFRPPPLSPLPLAPRTRAQDPRGRKIRASIVRALLEAQVGSAPGPPMRQRGRGCLLLLEGRTAEKRRLFLALCSASLSLCATTNPPAQRRGPPSGGRDGAPPPPPSAWPPWPTRTRPACRALLLERGVSRGGRGEQKELSVSVSARVASGWVVCVWCDVSEWAGAGGGADKGADGRRGSGPPAIVAAAAVAAWAWARSRRMPQRRGRFDAPLQRPPPARPAARLPLARDGARARGPNLPTRACRQLSSERKGTAFCEREPASRLSPRRACP